VGLLKDFDAFGEDSAVFGPHLMPEVDDAAGGFLFAADE
jgi:hypothetical protein